MQTERLLIVQRKLSQTDDCWAVEKVTRWQGERRGKEERCSHPPLSGYFFSDGGVCCGECGAVRGHPGIGGVQEPVWAPALLDDYRAVPCSGLCTFTETRRSSGDGINNMKPSLVLLFLGSSFYFFPFHCPLSWTLFLSSNLFFCILFFSTIFSILYSSLN